MSMCGPIWSPLLPIPLKMCVLGANRTHNLQIRSLSLCPIELRGRDIYLIPKILTKGKEFFVF